MLRRREERLSITHQAPESICQAAKCVVAVCSLVSRALIIGQRLNQGSEWGFPFIIFSHPWPSNLVVLFLHLGTSNPPNPPHTHWAVTTGQPLTNYTHITPHSCRPQNCCCLEFHSDRHPTPSKPFLVTFFFRTLSMNHKTDMFDMFIFPLHVPCMHSHLQSVTFICLVSCHWTVTITPGSWYLQTQVILVLCD